MKKQKMWLWLSSVVLFVAVGCTVATNTEGEPIVTAETTSPDTAVPPTPSEDSLTPRPTAATPAFEAVPTTAVSPVVAELPEAIMTAVYEDLITTTDLQKEAFTIIRAEAVVWNDGALGCPQPGEVYTQATVNGYWIILQANGRTYDYHVAESGYFILCQNSLPLSPPISGTPTS